MKDSKPCNLPADFERRSVLKSIAGIAAASALHPSVEGFAQHAGESAASIGQIASVAAGVATYELVEFKVPVRGAEFENLSPYRAAELALEAEITLPSGKTMRVPGFYSQDFTAHDSDATPVDGTRGWRIRFSGPEPGDYKGKVELRVRGKLAASREMPPFKLIRSKNHGVIRVSRTAPRYLEFEDGAGYFPVGQDVCWTTDVTKSIPGAICHAETLPWDEAYARWFGRMGENGATWARVFMKESFLIDAGEPWQWELEKAWRFDQVLEMARKNNINICLCFNPERSDDGAAYKGSMDIFRASNTAWGRLLASQNLGYDQFFLNPLTREMYKDKIRYVVARWGYSTNIFSWEFWNEIESTSPRQGIYAWMREMTAYLRSVDPWHHLIKSSAHHEWSPEFWGEDNGDLNDVHPYFGWAGWDGTQNLGAFLPEFSSGVYSTGRPFLIGETGIAREVTTPLGLAGDLADKDTTCFHVHEALWGGLFAGAVGSGMVWWWDEHVDLHNGYFRFRAISNFVDDIQFNRENFTRGHTSAVSTDDLKFFELVGRRSRLLWLRHRDLGWYNLAVEKMVFDPIASASLTLTGMMPGAYRVEYWSPEEGKLIKSAEFVARNSSLEVPLPEIRSELALKVKPAATNLRLTE
jgi:hypothetical protein